MQSNPTAPRELDTEIRPDTFNATMRLKVTASYIMWGKQGMHWKDVMAARYGTLPRQGMGTIFYVLLRSTKGVVLELAFSNFISSHASSSYLLIVDWINHNFQKTMIERYHKKVLEGTTVNIGDLQLTKAGIVYKWKTWNSEVPYTIPWMSIVLAAATFNKLVISDGNNRNNSATIDILEVWNACFLHDYLMKLTVSKEMQEELRAIQEG